jgi:hypothetical protein
MSESDINDIKDLSKDISYQLGKRLGRSQAFDMVAKRCSAAEAETLKSIRDSGEYKQLGLTWAQFCAQELGVSKAFADRQIQYLEQFGAAYYRMSEVMQISGETYKLISGSVVDDCIEVKGERIPITRENRKKVTAAVKTLSQRPRAAPKGELAIDALRQSLSALLAEACQVARLGDKRLELMMLLLAGRDSLDKLAEDIRCKTVIVG